MLIFSVTVDILPSDELQSLNSLSEAVQVTTAHSQRDLLLPLAIYKANKRTICEPPQVFTGS